MQQVGEAAIAHPEGVGALHRPGWIVLGTVLDLRAREGHVHLMADLAVRRLKVVAGHRMRTPQMRILPLLGLPVSAPLARELFGTQGRPDPSEG